MAVKEEKYEPGYEAAYGGAYNESPCPGDPWGFSSDGLGVSPPFCWPVQRLGFAGIGGKGVFWRELITEEWEWKNRNLFSEWRTSLIVQWLGYRLTLQRA